MIPDLEHKIQYAQDIFENSRTEFIGTFRLHDVNHDNRRPIPYHLHYDITRIAHQYHSEGYINTVDEQFIQTVYTKSAEWLCKNVYLLGEWHVYPNNKAKIHNIQTKRSYKR